MRRYWRETSSARTFRGAELPRLLTGIVMLAVLWMLFTRAREPETWRWLAAGDGQPPAGAAATAAVDNRDKIKQSLDAQVPEPTGPTDEDPDQAETARNDFQVLTDGTLKLTPEEQLSYDRLVEWVKNQSFARLEQRAKNGVWYADFYAEPDKHRGQLVAIDLNVRLVKNLGDERYGMPLYELWGATEESRGRLYDAIAIDYPKDMPDSGFVNERVRFAGYFLKLQGYEPAMAKLGQAPDKAPLLIGRLKREPIAISITDNTAELTWGTIVLSVLVAAWAMWRIYEKLRGKKPNSPASLLAASTGDAASIDSWLEQSSVGANQNDDVAETHDDGVVGDEDHPDGPNYDSPQPPEGLD